MMTKKRSKKSLMLLEDSATGGQVGKICLKHDKITLN